MSIKMKRVLACLMFVGLIMTSFPVMTNAMDGSTEGVGEVVLPTNSENVVSVILPTVSAESPFDFLIDPERLVYKTGASKYGGGVVEEDANILFHNRLAEGVDFSRNSDLLSVTNKSSVPVDVKISARVKNLGEIKLSENTDIAELEEPVLYLALIDDDGNKKVMSEDVIDTNITLDRAPAGVYTWIYDESSDSYRYVIGDDQDVIYDSYSFGLTGECSNSEKWKNADVQPQVEITWEIEPVLESSVENNGQKEYYEEDYDNSQVDELEPNDLNIDNVDMEINEMEFAGDMENPSEITIGENTQ